MLQTVSVEFQINMHKKRIFFPKGNLQKSPLTSFSYLLEFITALQDLVRQDKKSSFSFLKWYLSKSVTHTVYHLKNSIRACAIYTRPLNQLVVIELLSYKGAVVHRSKGRLSQTFEWLLLVSSAAFMPQCTASTIVATRHILFFSVFCRHSRGQCCISHFSKNL